MATDRATVTLPGEVVYARYRSKPWVLSDLEKDPCYTGGTYYTVADYLAAQK